MQFTRRDFGKIGMAAGSAAAGLSIPNLGWAAQSSKIDGVQIGTITYSFRGSPAQGGVAAPDMPAAMQKIGLSEVELMSGDCEIIAGIPQNPNVGRGGGGFGGRGGSGRGGGRGGAANGEVAMAGNGCPVNSPSGRDYVSKHPDPNAPAPAARGGGFGGGRGNMTPEQQAAQEAYQKSVTDWRKGATAARWKDVKKKFNDAGVDVQILCYNMNINSTTDDEVDYAFQMARDMGVRAISCSSTIAMAKKVAPFADKYKIMWGGHGHYDIYDPEQFSTPESFRTIMGFSKYIGVNLDIGHFTQAGFDPMTFIPEIHARITNIHLKDSMKPDKCGAAGPTQPWGQGQTPIKEVLLLMKKNKYQFPANIELEYRIPQGSDSVAEVAKCYEFAKKCFA